jgi:hypothetical protein
VDNKKAINNLRLVKKVFDKFEVKFRLAYGTALGAYRDKEFLPEDNDIDLVITDKVDYKTKKDIGWMLYDLGFRPADVAFNVFGRFEPVEIGYNGDENTGIIVCEKDHIEFSIFFFYEENCDKHGKEYVCIPKLGALKLISTPTKFYEKEDKIIFYKEEFLLPSPIEKYLAFTYRDWKNPLARDHGLTYFEMHPEHTEVLKKIWDKNQVYHAVKQNEEVFGGS